MKYVENPKGNIYPIDDKLLDEVLAYEGYKQVTKKRYQRYIGNLKRLSKIAFRLGCRSIEEMMKYLENGKQMNKDGYYIIREFGRNYLITPNKTRLRLPVEFRYYDK